MIAAAFAALYLLFTRGCSHIWDKNLSLEIRFDGDGIFEGESGKIVQTITNAKFAPFLFGSISYRVPHSLAFNGKTYGNDIYREDRVSLFSYEQVTRRLPFTALHRGCFTVGDASAAEDDILFRCRYLHRFPTSCEVMVFPRVKGVENFPLDFRRLTGDIVSRRSVIEDPFYFRGIRDWSPTDSIRRVNWNATARTGGLKVNQFESTHSQKVLLMLDFDGYNRFDREEIREDSIRIAAYLSKKLLENGVPTGLVTNALETGGQNRVETNWANGRNQYFALLRAMARIETNRLSGSFCDLLDAAERNSGSTQYIVISSYADAELDKRIFRLNSLGAGVSWIFLRDKARRIDYAPRSRVYLCEMEY